MPSIDSGTVMAALERRYRPPEWGLFAQVGNGTGFQGNRWADAMAMGLWPSRGLTLHGFEIKVSRADWLRELKDPAKAEDIACYCDFWNVVVSAPGIVLPGELPAAWGLMQLSGRQLRTVTAAPQRTDAATLDRPIVAAILRRASECMVPRSSIAAAIEDARAQGVRSATEMSRHAEERHAREAESMRRTIAEFEKASGVHLPMYGSGDVGRRFRLALALDTLQADYRLSHAENELAAALAAVRSARAANGGTTDAAAVPDG